jgi:serine/threonine-protein kinase
MHLATGERLGPYEIIAQIGAGGMGVVYRARDPRVGRDVAIKVSAERFSGRFEREARAVAALNHPNICTLYDVGPNYLVMELVEGEPPKGPMPFQAALDYARQIALALDAAHEKGIVHRDLKPENIRIKSDGTVKVLDFGLAKIETGGAAADDPANSPTMSVQGTQAGMILGTAAYMAPEQARGKSVDKRADIWAFGVVFYEMLTGRRAFDGEDVSTILAAVLQSEPRWDGMPANVRRVLESCLEKDPRKRLRDIGDVWRLLEDAPTPAASPSRSARVGWIAAAALAGVAAIALWAPWRTAPRDAAPPLLRLDVDLGPDVSLVPLIAPTFSSLIISPDGTRLVFVGSVSGAPSRLFVRRLDDGTMTELAGTQGAISPFFSADGQWVAFWNGGKLAKVPVEGGGVVPLTDLSVMTGGSWADDGHLVVGSGIPGTAGLVRIASGGGTPTPIVNLASRELFHTFPHVVPGRNAVLVGAVGTPPTIETTNIDIVSLENGRRKTIVRGGTSPRYLPSGHVLYASRAGMFAVPFDIDTWETRGAAVPVLSDAVLDPRTGGAQFDVSRGGTLVYRKHAGGAASTPMHVQWLDGTGKQEPLLGKPGVYVGTPRLSRDGRLAIAIRDGANEDIWVYHPQRDTMTRLTPGGATFESPVWRDGRYVIFGSLGGGMLWARADGAGPPQMLSDRLCPSAIAGCIQWPTSLTRDGTRLAFEQVDGKPQIWTVELSEDEQGLKAGTPTRFLSSPYQDGGAAFSPDGQWIAYHSNESGRFEVYVRPFSTSSGKESQVQISNSGGGQPVWLPKGGELLYQASGQIMAVGYTTSGGSFLAGKPRVWAGNVSGATGFDVAQDGKRLALILPTTTRAMPNQDHTVVFVQNILDELRRRAPVGR